MQVPLPVMKQLPKQKTQQILYPQAQAYPAQQKMLRSMAQIFKMNRKLLRLLRNLLRKGPSICPKQPVQSLKKTV